MHPKHPERERIVFRKRPKAMQGCRHREAGLVCESLHEVLSTSRFGTTTDIEDGLLCLCDQLCSTLDLNLMDFEVRLEA